MTTTTLLSAIPANQNQAGPAVPAPAIADAGGLITRAVFTLTVSPVTGWAEAAVAWGTDGVNFSGGLSIFAAPGGTGTQTQTQHFHSGALSAASGGNDGARYFKPEMLTVSPGATATLTMTY